MLFYANLGFQFLINPNSISFSWPGSTVTSASNIEQVREAAPDKAAAVRPPTTHQKTIKIRWTRHAGHFRRSRDQLICDILLWTPSHGRAKAGRPARTYIEQFSADTRCSLEDRPRAVDVRDWWRERVREIRVGGVTWWWWWWWSERKN